MNHRGKPIYIRMNQGRASGSGGPGQPGGGPGGNWFTRIVGLFFLLVFVGLAVTFGFFILIIGMILMIPVLWRRRHAIKQLWQIRKQAKAQYEQSKKSYQEQQQRQQESQDSTTIEGEYEEVDKDDKR
ncbi:MAG: hypothetical protein ACQEQZ_05950 [Pseudomonadota bacterium]